MADWSLLGKLAVDHYFDDTNSNSSSQRVSDTTITWNNNLAALDIQVNGHYFDDTNSNSSSQRVSDTIITWNNNLAALDIQTVEFAGSGSGGEGGGGEGSTGQQFWG